jgi:anion-transporting  ArsA/GET3 family ATPase
MTRSLGELVRDASIIVCSGSGGVGKTTTAATLALQAAKQRRRAVVVTIDPAKRLADALGLGGGLTNDPTRIDLGDAADDGRSGGELWAMMLDTRTTFDELVHRHASDAEQAERILGNRFYRNISGALSGTQEYMAAEKLYELHQDERFDLVVVDTPPTRNALDFLEAPNRLTRFLDHRLYRLLLAPARSGLKVLNVAAQPVLRTIGKVVGTDTLSDAIAFFQAFDGMEAGFRERAAHVVELLHADETAYVLVASPRHDTIDEASFFAGTLHRSGLRVAALVVNRLHPRFGGTTAAEAKARVAAADEPGLASLWENLAELCVMADDEDAELGELFEAIGDAAVARVPLLAGDVHDLDGLHEMARHLFG